RRRSRCIFVALETPCCGAPQLLGVSLLSRGVLPRCCRLGGSDCLRLVGCSFGCDVCAAFPTIGIIGSPCVSIIEPCSRDCILIEPVGVGLLLGILNTASRSVTIDVERRPFRVAL